MNIVPKDEFHKKSYFNVKSNFTEKEGDVWLGRRASASNFALHALRRTKPHLNKHTSQYVDRNYTTLTTMGDYSPSAVPTEAPPVEYGSVDIAVAVLPKIFSVLSFAGE